MSRDLRIEYEGAFHHVINRGYQQMNIFNDDQDFKHFINDLEETFRSHILVIHAYCLMTNHFHLFTETPNADLQKAMHKLQTRYASYFKKKYDHSGKVFEKRYKAILVDTDTYALDLVRYIHRNPVGVIVKNPKSWTYSSYRQFLGYDKRLCFLDLDLILNKFSRDRTKALAMFEKHMHAKSTRDWVPNDFIIGRSIMGSKDFVERIKNKLPEEINTELTGLISLKGNDKLQAIKTYVSVLNFDLKTKINLLIYALRQKTYLNTKEISEMIGGRFKKSTLSSRISHLKAKSLKDLDVAKALIHIDSL